MSIIYRYITIQISKYFGIVLTFVIGIYISVDFFEKIDDFMEAGLPYSKTIFFFILEIPSVIVQIIPICILLAVLIVFSLMTRHNEILALRSSGVRIYYLFKPVVIIGCTLSGLLFLFSDVIVPITKAKSNQIWLREVRKESTVVTEEKNIWIKGNRLITHINYFNPKVKTIYGITVYRFDQRFQLIRRIDAKKGVFKQKKWLLYGIMEQNLDKEQGDYNITFHYSI